MKSNVHSPKNAKALQRAFFKAAGPGIALLRQMFDGLPNVSSYIKDAEGRFMAINRRNCELCGLSGEGAVIGKRSCDIFPKRIADVIMARDRQVLETGEPIIDRTEPRTANNPADTVTISIYPVKGRNGRIIGTACAYYSRDRHGALPNADKIEQAVAHLEQHFAEDIAVHELSARFHLSPATFYRAFAARMRSTPGEYLTSLRLCRARELLETTDKTIAAIAQDCGFYDHSHFIRIFRHTCGLTPSLYRKKHRVRGGQGQDPTESTSRAAKDRTERP